MTQKTYERLGAAIRKRREAILMTQADLARRIGLSRTSVTNIEGGGQALLVHQLLDIAAALNIPVAELLQSLGAHTGPQRDIELDEEMLGLLGKLRRTSKTRARA